MGSRCGTLTYVPFKESWPPTENNLAGPYWERRLQGKGIHAPGYTPVLAGPDKYSRAGGIRRRGAGGGGGAFFGPNSRLFFACALTFAAIGACAMGFASCCSGDDAGPGASRRQGGGGGRKPRGRHQWARRAGILGARSED